LAEGTLCVLATSKNLRREVVGLKAEVANLQAEVVDHPLPGVCDAYGEWLAGQSATETRQVFDQSVKFNSAKTTNCGKLMSVFFGVRK